jgi:hypothetical protein
VGSLFSILLFRIDNARLARKFLADWLANMPGGRPAALKRPVLHFAFSWRGLKKLLEGRADLDVSSPEFEFFFTEPNHFPDGLAMANSFGFSGINSPDGWWKSRSGSGFKTSDIDFALHGSFDTEAEQATWLDEVRQSGAGKGLTELEIDSFHNRALSGYRPDGGILHFGYRDGITQPDIDWDDAGTPGKVDFREFITGYPNHDYEISPTTPGKWQDFAKEGSFACLTWLYQDVAKFNQFLRDSADAALPYAGAADPKEWVAAKLLGRWRNGTPLAHDPDAPPNSPSEDDLKKPFDFADDPDGLRCPLVPIFAWSIRAERRPLVMRTGFGFRKGHRNCFGVDFPMDHAWKARWMTDRTEDSSASSSVHGLTNNFTRSCAGCRKLISAMIFFARPTLLILRMS